MLALLTVGFLAAGTAGCTSFTEERPASKRPEESTGVPVTKTGCDKYTSPSGSDANAGTHDAPFGTPQKLSDSLRPGQTGCLISGTHSEPDGLWILAAGGAGNDQRITIRSVPGQRAGYEGRLWVPDDVSYVTVSDVVLDGSASPVGDDSDRPLPSVTVNGDYAEFLNNEVTTGSRGGCFNLGHATYGTAVGTLIRNNEIHHCGGFEPGHGHAIYAAEAEGTRILGNRIYGNEARAVQLYPNADGTLVANNVIDRNGVGVIFSGSGDRVSEDNEVRNNVISNSEERWLVEDNYNQTDLVGMGNAVHHNCVWATNPDPYFNRNGGIRPGAGGFDARDNVEAEPTYADPANGDYGLRPGSRCGPLLNSAP